MSKRKIYGLASLVFSLVFTIIVLVGVANPAHGAQPAGQTAPEIWPGVWQIGPNMDATIWGGSAGEGIARFSGYYYSPQNRVYFLGGRKENNDTTGTIFYFDPVTRNFLASGAVLETPISNYLVSELTDTTDTGLYVAGGRMNSGVNTNALQVYYPASNTVATISTDPVPGSVRAVGGQASVNNKLYIFGGFDGVSMYAETYIYDPALPAGSRWSNTNCDLPTPRSYISTVAVGNLIYAIGGDEFDGAGLVPLDDTLVLDTTNLPACWQDPAMADLPQANGDAPAVYVDSGFLGGGIFVIGGFWPSPGPYRWVFRYDIATDTWEDFPQLVIPDPATGRRNQAAVYIPSTTMRSPEGLGNGVPGIWTFGGYDTPTTMSETSEFFSYSNSPILVLPEQLEVATVPGQTAVHNFLLYNQSGITDTFNLSYTSDVTWTTLLPSSVGPVVNGGLDNFTMPVDIPASVGCPDTGVFTVTAIAQSSILISDTQQVSVRAVCGIGGTVLDATSSMPIQNAYVWIQDTPDGLGQYLDAYTDSNGDYAILDVPPGDWFLGVDAAYHQPSFYPGGWPEGAITFTISANSLSIDVNLVSSQIAWDPGSFNTTVTAGQQIHSTLTITNSGTGPLFFNISTMDGSVPTPPPAKRPDIPEPDRIDPQIEQDMAQSPDGTAEFLVVLKDQADLGAAYAIENWDARGSYVYETLKTFAQQSQRNLLDSLNSAGVEYIPLYIINGVIVKNGDAALVSHLARLSEVSQLVANHRIAIEKTITIPSLLDRLQAGPEGPNTLEWGIDRVDADLVWSNFGVRGEGIVVASIDSGVQYNHPALYRQYRGWLGGSSYNHNYNWYDPYHQGPGGGIIPQDVSGHGTHTMGTMVGEDASQTNQIGVAPGAKWIACDGGDDVSGYLLTDELLQCAQWIVAPWDLNGMNPDPSKRPNIVNNSWGGGSADYWFTGAIDAWRAAGIFPQFSNGNNGPACSTAGSPGDNWNVFSAGATDINNAIASFSSRGPSSFYGYLKPDISAPGVNVRSSVPTNSYALYNGTSMASPHVAGAVALLWSADPELIGQIDLTGWILQQSATPLYTDDGCGGNTSNSHPNYTFGYGLVNAYKAVVFAHGEPMPEAGWISVSPSMGELMPGEMMTLDVAFSGTYDISGTITGTIWLVSDDPLNHDLRLPVSLTVLGIQPTAAFDSPPSAFVGEVISFTNQTTGTLPIDYMWNFGDGITSTVESPTHTYGNSGAYTVTLEAMNALGSDMVSHSIEIYSLPDASFTTNSPVDLGEAIVFTNTSTGTGPLDALWEFGDAMTSTLSSPTHTYASVGSYVVTLTVTSPYGSDWVTGTVMVQSVLPIADFSSNSPINLGETAVFTNMSTGTGPFEYLWDFGDGITSTLQNPTHMYTNSGTFQVMLIVTTPYGTDSSTQDFMVVEAIFRVYLPVIMK